MIVQSTRLGELDLPDDSILNFGHGLPGFPDQKSFVLLPYGGDSPFAFLQSTVDPDLTFLLADPFAFFADYQFELNDAIAAELGVSENNPPQVWCIVTVPAKSEEMTANLIAPVILNTRDRQGRQIVLEAKHYTTRHRLLPDSLDRGGK